VAGGSDQRRRGIRIRIGVTMVAVSWLPVAQVIIWATSPPSGQADEIRAAIWGFQIVLGAIGVIIAGRETIRVAKSVGWRKSPRAMWELFRSPDAPVGGA
jgi:hypothetical protein